MTPIIPPRLRAFRAEDDTVAPNRRRTSDGWYANKPGDHNMDSRGVVHADDTSLSVPGSPYWGNGISPLNGRPYSVLDTVAGARAVVAHYRSLTPGQRAARWPWLFDGGYMVWFERALGYEVIFDPRTHPSDNGTRPNGHPKIGHTEHLHRSIAHTLRSENDTQPFFLLEDDDMTPDEFHDLMVGNDGTGGFVSKIKSDTNAVVRARLADTLPDLVEAAVQKYVENKLGGYVGGVWKPDALADKVLPEARTKYGLSKAASQ